MRGVVSPAVFAAASCTRTFTLCDYPGKGTSSNRRLINRKGNALYSTTGFGLSRVQNEPQAREPSGTALASSGLLVGWLKLRVCKAQARWQGERLTLEITWLPLTSQIWPSVLLP
jgi:hypothetical protein